MVKQFATFLGAGQIVPAYFSFSARPIYIPRVATFSADPILAQMDPGRAVLRGVTTITYVAIVPALARLGTMPTTVTSPHSASVRVNTCRCRVLRSGQGSPFMCDVFVFRTCNVPCYFVVLIRDLALFTLLLWMTCSLFSMICCLFICYCL